MTSIDDHPAAMRDRTGRPAWRRPVLSRVRHRLTADERFLKILRNWALVGFAVAGIAMAFATHWAVTGFLAGSPGAFAVIIIAVDQILILAFMAFAAQQVESKRARRAARHVTSPIHLRFSRAFALAAFLPSAVVSVTATCVIGFFLGAWLVSDVHRSLVNATGAVRDHVDKAVDALLEDAPKFARDFEFGLAGLPDESGRQRRVLNALQASSDWAESWKYAFVIDSRCTIIARGDRSYKFRYDPPPRNIMRSLADDADAGAACAANLEGMDRPILARDGEDAPSLTGRSWLIEDGLVRGAVYPYDDSELAALVSLPPPGDRYLLMVTRGNSRAFLQLSASLEGRSGDFSTNSIRQLGRYILIATLLFLPVSLGTICGVILLGRRFSSRLSPPFRKLARAVERIGEGNLVPIDPTLLRGQDEITAFARGFDRMVGQLRNNIEMRRSVIENVTAGVVGYAPDRTATFRNRPAAHFLDLTAHESSRSRLIGIQPAVMGMLDQIDADRHSRLIERRLRVLDQGRQIELLVRAVASHAPGGDVEGYVVTFDDVTQLVSAESQAAWTEAAKLVTHEVRNPLQGIVNSLFLIRSGLAGLDIGAGKEETIIRNNLDLIESRVTALERLTTAFSTVGRMPELTLRAHDLCELAESVLSGEREQGFGIDYRLSTPQAPINIMVDADYVARLVGNLLINARHAIDERRSEVDFEPVIELIVDPGDEFVTIEVRDNGPGFPPGADARSRILMAGVTTRAEGSGLGLFIVRDAAEKHGGGIILDDAPPFDNADHRGASVKVTIRRILPPDEETEAADGEGSPIAKPGGEMTAPADHGTHGSDHAPRGLGGQDR